MKKINGVSKALVTVGIVAGLSGCDSIVKGNINGFKGIGEYFEDSLRQEEINLIVDKFRREIPSKALKPLPLNELLDKKRMEVEKLGVANFSGLAEKVFSEVAVNYEGIRDLLESSALFMGVREVDGDLENFVDKERIVEVEERLKKVGYELSEVVSNDEKEIKLFLKEEKGGEFMLSVNKFKTSKGFHINVVDFTLGSSGGFLGNLRHESGYTDLNKFSQPASALGLYSFSDEKGDESIMIATSGELVKIRAEEKGKTEVSIKVNGSNEWVDVKTLDELVDFAKKCGSTDLLMKLLKDFQYDLKLDCSGVSVGVDEMAKALPADYGIPAKF